MFFANTAASASIRNYATAHSRTTTAAAAAAVVASVSLGQPCTDDSECAAADADSVCGRDGVCACAVFQDDVGGGGGGGGGDDGFYYAQRPLKLLRSWLTQRRRRPRSARWFCQRRRVRLCPEGTFQVRTGVFVSKLVSLVSMDLYLLSCPRLACCEKLNMWLDLY